MAAVIVRIVFVVRGFIGLIFNIDKDGNLLPRQSNVRPALYPIIMLLEIYIPPPQLPEYLQFRLRVPGLDQ